MLTSAIGRRSFHQVLTLKARDVLLTLLVGMLAGNLLLAVSGGFPLSASASAAPDATTYQPANVLNLSYRLNPSNPAQVGEVRLQADTLQGDTPHSLSVRVASAAANWIACSLVTGTWVCPVSEVAVTDLASLEVRAN
jgi:hypothetical protein